MTERQSRLLQFDRSYMDMAHVWAGNSRAVRLKVGALIVKDGRIISDGFNGTPSGFDNVCEYELCGKLVTKREVLHAEANAITKVAKSTMSCDGATLYVTDSPCFDCAKLIIQSGIARVVYDREYRITDGIELLRKAGVAVECISAQ